jgi:hypothetical protein
MENSTNVETQSEGSNTVEIEKVMEELKALKSSNERLLTESKDWKAKYQSAYTEKTGIEKQRLEKEGNFQQLLEQEKKEKLEIEKKLKDREKSLLKTQARAMLAELAKDAHDVGDLLKLDEVSAIQYDEENLTVLKDSVQNFVASVREKKPWMFGEKKIPTSTDGKPSTSSAKSFAQMTSNEREAEMKNSFKQLL